MGGIRPALPLKGDCMLDFMTYLPPVTDAPLPEPGSAGAFFLLKGEFFFPTVAHLGSNNCWCFSGNIKK